MQTTSTTPAPCIHLRVGWNICRWIIPSTEGGSGVGEGVQHPTYPLAQWVVVSRDAQEQRCLVVACFPFSMGTAPGNDVAPCTAVVEGLRVVWRQRFGPHGPHDVLQIHLCRNGRPQQATITSGGKHLECGVDAVQDESVFCNQTDTVGTKSASGHSGHLNVSSIMQKMPFPGNYNWQQNVSYRVAYSVC